MFRPGPWGKLVATFQLFLPLLNSPCRLFLSSRGHQYFCTSAGGTHLRRGEGYQNYSKEAWCSESSLWTVLLCLTSLHCQTAVTRVRYSGKDWTHPAGNTKTDSQRAQQHLIPRRSSQKLLLQKLKGSQGGLHGMFASKGLCLPRKGEGHVYTIQTQRKKSKSETTNSSQR